MMRGRVCGARGRTSPTLAALGVSHQPQSCEPQPKILSEKQAWPEGACAMALGTERRSDAATKRSGLCYHRHVSRNEDVIRNSGI